MRTYNLVCKPNLDLPQLDRNEENLIIAEQNQLKKIERQIGASFDDTIVYNDEFPVLFAPGNGYDFFSFVFLEGNQKNEHFEKVSLILMEKLLIIVISMQSLHHFTRGELVDISALGNVSTVYFSFMELAFTGMFVQLGEYEDYLHHIEVQLVSGSKEYKIKDIILERNMCLTVKKYMCQLFLCSEDLKLNLNNLIPEHEMRLLPNIGAKISLLNEMALHLTEMSAHLLEVYDSTVSTKTNSNINKLTVFNFFATPITILSGIYGMNFVNMPELHHPYGYFIVLGVMLGISALIFTILKKMKLI